jgi:hypothetical protein
MLLFIVGFALLVVVFADFLETTLGAQSAGPITRVLSRTAFGVEKGVRSAGGSWIHRYSGPLTLSIVGTGWISMHWLAWTLIFLSDPQSVLIDETGEPAGPMETAAYVGSMLSTLGASRAHAGTPLWDVVSALAAMNGMVVLTLSVTFVVNITRTVTEGRSFAALVDALDLDNPSEVEHLRKALADIAAQFAAYPLAHTFSTAHRDRRVVPAMAHFIDRVVDDANLESYRPMLRLLHGVDAAGDVAHVKADVHRWAERHTLGGAARQA